MFPEHGSLIVCKDSRKASLNNAKLVTILEKTFASLIVCKHSRKASLNNAKLVTILKKTFASRSDAKVA